MKTIKTFKGVFTKNKVTLEEALEMKQYTFNTEDEIEVSELIFSPQYKKYIQVTFIYEHAYQYVNVKTGALAIVASEFPFVPIKIIKQDENRTDNTVET